jgi:hypothetical protein
MSVVLSILNIQSTVITLLPCQEHITISSSSQRVSALITSLSAYTIIIYLTWLIVPYSYFFVTIFTSHLVYLFLFQLFCLCQVSMKYYFTFLEEQTLSFLSKSHHVEASFLRRLIAIFTTGLHWSVSWASLIHSDPSRHIYLRFVLILPFHLRLGLSSDFSFQGFRQNLVYIFNHICVLHGPRTDRLRKGVSAFLQRTAENGQRQQCQNWFSIIYGLVMKYRTLNQRWIGWLSVKGFAMAERIKAGAENEWTLRLIWGEFHKEVWHLYAYKRTSVCTCILVELSCVLWN